METPPLLQVNDLKVHFPIKAGVLRRQVGTIKAVDGVSFQVLPGETVGLVGESGCGKTTTGRAIAGLVNITEGSVVFDGRDITGLGRRALRSVRRDLQYIFQDPYSSLNPIRTVGDIVAEPLRIHGLFDDYGGDDYVDELFSLVGLSPSLRNRYPREFSGGQRQRIGIARALALKPKLLILDEPVAALDVSIQAQIVNLLQDLQHKLGLTYLFIAHDLTVVEHISTRVAVMYLGSLAELAPSEELYKEPLHPYTRALLSAVPVPEPTRKRERIVLKGEIPSPLNPPTGCKFHPRCPDVMDVCKQEVPELVQIGKTRVACHLYKASA